MSWAAGSSWRLGLKALVHPKAAKKLEPAVQTDMGESAIGSECIDFILSPEGIARKIMEIIHRDI